jgi:hypothetical protein
MGLFYLGEEIDGVKTSETNPRKILTPDSILPGCSLKQP